MKQLPKYPAGLLLVAAMAFSPGAHAAERLERLGISQAYNRLGHVAVMHAGRVKPLDTVARQEVEQVYGSEKIRLRDAQDEVEKILNPNAPGGKRSTPRRVEEWGPVGAFLGWTVRPEFWNEQPFILVDHLPLRRAILAGTIESRLKEIAEKSTTPATEKPRLRALAVEPALTASLLAEFVSGSKLPAEDRETVAGLAARLTKSHRWLSPRELEEASIAGGDGAPAVPFLAWASAASDRKERFDASPRSVDRPTELERRGIEVARRLTVYEAYRGERLSPAGILRIQPRPFDVTYLNFTREAYNEAIAQRSADHLQPLQRDAVASLLSYWALVPREDQRTPGEDSKADARFTAWLRDNSTWIPLRALVDANPETLLDAGYRADPVKAFVDAFHQVAQTERQAPGHLSESTASSFLHASRALGEVVSPRYPSSAAIERETRFNTLNPFGLAACAYGTGLVLLVLSLAMVQTRSTPSPLRVAGRAMYWLGLAAMVAGIALELVGFSLRILISGWAPVTNMYETVVWVALVAAVLSLIFERIFRAGSIALAGAAVALLCTWTAGSVSLLDPSIRSLQPVLRDNFWLGTHVLVIVSSYAAFALAWVLGLIATVHFLTGTYRRSPRMGELMLILIPGLPLLSVGGAGVAASYGLLGTEWTTGDALFLTHAVMAWFGGVVSLSAVLAVAGELIARLRDQADPPKPVVETTAVPGVADVPTTEAALHVPPDVRRAAMARTASQAKPLVNFMDRAIQVGVLLIAAGTIQGGLWADYSWGRFWGWDAKEVWALTTLIVYLIPLHGRFAGWVNPFWFAFASVFCFLSVVMAWYGVNFVLGVGLHSYGFVEGGSQGVMSILIAIVLAWPVAAAWRRFLANRPVLVPAVGKRGSQSLTSPRWSDR